MQKEITPRGIEPFLQCVSMASYPLDYELEKIRKNAKTDYIEFIFCNILWKNIYLYFHQGSMPNVVQISTLAYPCLYI